MLLLRLRVFGDESVEVGTAQSFDVVTHSDATRTGVTPLLGNAEAEFVGVALVGRDAHLEDADAFCALVVNLVVVVSVLDLLEALLLAEFNFVDDRAVQVQRKVVLETEFQLAVGFDDRSFLRLDQVALLRDVLIGEAANRADAAHFTHVRLFHKVDFTADGGHISGNFQVFARI